MTVPAAEGGDAHGNPRPGIGLSRLQRPTTTVGHEDAISSHDEHIEARGVEDAYADHIHDHRNGDYPPEPPPAPTQAQLDELLAANRVDPGTTSRTMFVKIGEYEDPASGRPLPSSPIERLRQDLERLQGAAGESLKVRLQFARLTEQDLGTWQAATDLKYTTDQAQTTLDQVITRVTQVYEAVVQALDETVKTAKNADRSIAGGVRK
ncbi:hypothetical protein ABZW11_28220 [Nonomuraea sp. NPDC004580]|uniref:hypothetical protein n=1 Tax=Nonomuraea sp. NPDC004580 TaxID=3154552 RepID=UPI00339E16CF